MTIPKNTCQSHYINIKKIMTFAVFFFQAGYFDENGMNIPENQGIATVYTMHGAAKYEVKNFFFFFVFVFFTQ